MIPGSFLISSIRNRVPPVTAAFFSKISEFMDNHLQWLVNNKEFISINKIEQELSMPQGTLKKFVDGNRDLPDHWHKSVIAWVKTFCRTKPVGERNILNENSKTSNHK